MHEVRARVGAQLPQHLEAVEAAALQPDVENDELRAALLDRAQRLVARAVTEHRFAKPAFALIAGALSATCAFMAWETLAWPLGALVLGNALPFGLRALGRGGRLIIVGLFGGNFSIPLPMFAFTGCQILGSVTGSPAGAQSHRGPSGSPIHR